MIITNNIAIEGLIKEIVNNGDSQTVRMESGEQAVYKKTSPRIPESMIGEKTVLSCKFVPSDEGSLAGHLMIENVYVSLKTSGQDVIREAIKNQIKQDSPETSTNATSTSKIEEKHTSLPSSENAHKYPIANKIRAKINEKIETHIEAHPRIDPQEIELIEPSIRRDKAHEDDIVMQPAIEDQPMAEANEKQASQLNDTAASQGLGNQEVEKKAANPFTKGAQERLPTNKKKSLLPGSAQPSDSSAQSAATSANATAIEKKEPTTMQKANSQPTQQGNMATRAFTPNPVLGKRTGHKAGVPSVPSR